MRDARAAAEPRERSLFQDTEMIRGQASSILKEVAGLAGRLGIEGGIEKEAPTRVPNNPQSILRDSYDDIERARTLINRILERVGSPGEGER